ncbi:MAG TPA: septation protein SepH, partial [Nocardioidaceae bacterium]|nr:septation protein SepH [Nocardioidaceae bacterium]
SVRRRTGEGPGRLLGDAVAERLRSRNVDPTSVEWDAWRREDGRWSLTASYSAGESATQAAFVYDAAGRYVVAEDDESRWLVGERVAHHDSPSRPAAADAATRRLAPVSDEELPLGEDAIEMVSEPERVETTADLTETARALRAVPAEELPISADHADADWMVTQASERPAKSAEASADESETTPPAKKAKGRASVPSWDEIMFGSGGRD